MTHDELMEEIKSRMPPVGEEFCQWHLDYLIQALTRHTAMLREELELALPYDATREEISQAINEVLGANEKGVCK